MNPATQFPHLTDTESVRREAESQYGGLNDAAAFLQAHKASLSADVSAASLRHRNGEETAKVQNDLGIAQKLIDKEYGSNTYRVVDAAVRGDALSAVVEDQYGRTSHLVVGYTDRWRSIARSGAEGEEKVNAEAEHARTRLGAEARAEIKRQVDEATQKIMENVAKLTGKRLDEVSEIREKALADTAKDDESSSDGEASRKKRGSPSSTEGNDTSEASAGKTAGSETSDAADDETAGTSDEAGEWPRRHDTLDDLAKKNKVDVSELGARPTIDDKIAALEKAGVKPPPPEE